MNFFRKRQKILLCSSGFIVIGSVALYDHPVGISLFRSARTLTTVAKLLFTYKTCVTLDEAHQYGAETVFNLCCANGGVYIKAGQIVNSARFGIPKPYLDRLKWLTDKAIPSRFEDVMLTLDESFGCKNAVETVFTEFVKEPIGCASLAQVHKATLSDSANGKSFPVAVKVQHRKLQYEVPCDLFVLRNVFRFLEWVMKDVRLEFLMDHIERGLAQEMDFTQEANNMNRCRHMLADVKGIVVPREVPKYTTKHVLVLEFMEGRNILDCLDYDPAVLLRASDVLLKSFAKMIFQFGFVHCDPHPGNILLQDDGTVVLLDHGLYRTLSEPFRQNYSAMWHHLFTRNDVGIQAAAIALGVPDFTDIFPLLFTQRVIGNKTRAQRQEVLASFKSMGLLSSSNNVQVFRLTDLLASVPDDFLFVLKTQMTVGTLTVQLGATGPMRQRLYAEEAHKRYMNELWALVQTRNPTMFPPSVTFCICWLQEWFRFQFWYWGFRLLLWT
eukprot:PhF_6_TR38860/c0_g1_i1/m.58112/K08869/ADCK, ABC1; aarF domain-containing kinase